MEAVGVSRCALLEHGVLSDCWDVRQKDSSFSKDITS